MGLKGVNFSQGYNFLSPYLYNHALAFNNEINYYHHNNEMKSLMVTANDLMTFPPELRLVMRLLRVWCMESDWLVLNEVIGGMLFTVVIGSFLKRYHARKFLKWVFLYSCDWFFLEKISCKEVFHSFQLNCLTNKIIAHEPFPSYTHKPVRMQFMLMHNIEI